MRTEQGLRVVRDVVEQDALDAGRIAHKKPVSRGKRFHEATLLFSLPDYCSDLAEIAILHPTRAVPLEKILVARIGLAPELLIAWSHWSNRAGEDLIDVTLCHFCLPKECRSALRGYSYKPPTTKHYATWRTADPKGNDDHAIIVRYQAVEVVNSGVGIEILFLPRCDPRPYRIQVKRSLLGHSGSSRCRPLASDMLSVSGRQRVPGAQRGSQG
jgi:hypothetical protein